MSKCLPVYDYRCQTTLYESVGNSTLALWICNSVRFTGYLTRWDSFRRTPETLEGATDADWLYAINQMQA